MLIKFVGNLKPSETLSERDLRRKMELAKLKKGYASEWMMLNSKHKALYSNENVELHSCVMSINCLTASLHGCDLWLGLPADHEWIRSWCWKKSILGHLNRGTVCLKDVDKILHYYGFGFFLVLDSTLKKNTKQNPNNSREPSTGPWKTHQMQDLHKKSGKTKVN